ncbi:hypothetical protein F4820DRAFT_225316 [Hypoxylon rubiginosum]|uniref:Uncharacterized protein n=1 Tax=Hypoxylon rubiginosum TaxID=110542 RepID=A0ACB9Z6W8_9PEZI|nr:hypothetical protein F4820DRAFT_225316 [Hypoxylon rubiginosum]
MYSVPAVPGPVFPQALAHPPFAALSALSTLFWSLSTLVPPSNKILRFLRIYSLPFSSPAFLSLVHSYRSYHFTYSLNSPKALTRKSIHTYIHNIYIQFRNPFQQL